MTRVLVVDDDSQMRELLGLVLQRKGYDVKTAMDGSVAVKLQKEKAFDLIITDIIMPEKEGLETIMEIRRIYPQIKIIAISGGGRHRPDVYLDLAEQLGANRILTKPFGSSEILSAVSDLVGH